ncbi:hypothetical protein N7G274_006381 [Stereocaulon virgatum]|uniref:Ecp2 effector protein domain-containing protein n=1 Tax=Stereocaulon virgatum TaxID=373712 RepID=A0ABR4A789_9LECA
MKYTASCILFILPTITIALMLPTYHTLHLRSSTPSLDPQILPISTNAEINTGITVPPQPPLPPKSSLPPSPPQPPAPHPPPSPPRRITCFKPSQRYAEAVVLEDCNDTIEQMLHSTPGPLEYQKWTLDGSGGSHKVPDAWHVGRCQAVVGASQGGDLNDKFRLVDVIWVMQQILAACVPVTEAGLGGMGDVGNGKGFYVSVNGHQAPRGDVERLMNKTSMAVEGSLTQSFGVGEVADSSGC